jgi:hypothetical protein
LRDFIIVLINRVGLERLRRTDEFGTLQEVVASLGS